MPRAAPTHFQAVLAGLVLPLLSVVLLPVSLVAVALCLAQAQVRRRLGGVNGLNRGSGKAEKKGCVIISGGKMTKGLHLARSFKRAGWEVIGVEEEGWGEYCPLRYSSSITAFHLLPPASAGYTAYSSALLHIAQLHRADLFIPVSGVASSVEDSLAADELYTHTQGRCRTFIQDPETMRDLHDKDRFMGLVDRLGMKIPAGQMVSSVKEAVEFLREEAGGKKRFVFKCMGLDENRGDMTLFPLEGDGEGLEATQQWLKGLKSAISEDNPYVFQEFIPGQECCTHASVVKGRLTSFVAAPSNDMLMTYENATTSSTGRLAEEWTTTFLDKLSNDPIPSSPSSPLSTPDSTQTQSRGLTGHFSFDFILSTTDNQLYPIECNARAHTAIVLLPLDGIAKCYDDEGDEDDLDPDTAFHRAVLRPTANTRPRSWIYNDLVMRYLPYLFSASMLETIHPSLPACSPAVVDKGKRPSEAPWVIRVDPTLVADDWVPFLVLWHVFWPRLLLEKLRQGKKWTRLNVSTGRIFEA